MYTMTQTTEIKTVRAKELRQHDICRGSGAKILANHGTQKLPGQRRKIVLSVQYPKGEPRKVLWGADTTISVERRLPTTTLQPCVACGELSTNRWCSTSCHVQEDLGGDPTNY